MRVTDVLQQMVNGLSLGALYALIAVGYTVVYGIVQLINFAHGEIFMVGRSGPWPRGLLISRGPRAIWVLPLMLAGGTGRCRSSPLLTERFAYRPLRNAPRLAPLITAIGVSVFLQEFIRLFYGRIPGSRTPSGRSRSRRSSRDGPGLRDGGLTIQRAAIFTLVALAICAASCSCS